MEQYKNVIGPIIEMFVVLFDRVNKDEEG